jgi:hypothetical protein
MQPWALPWRPAVIVDPVVSFDHLRPNDHHPIGVLLRIFG